MKGHKKIIWAVLLTLAMVITSVTVPGQMTKKASADGTAYNDLNQAQITADMGAGWNLGNSLEANINKVPGETQWGNPVISEKLIQAVKKAGFKTIRIPVSYLSMIGDAPSYTINSQWLDRIQEVVDYCINNDLYAIINMHGDGYKTIDGGWLICDAPDQEPIKAKYKACWEQIATRFKDYDEHLIFESMNEEFDNTYGTPNRTAYENINAYNQIFVDTVRQSGGNNDKRWVLIPGWNTDIDQTVGDYGFQLPTDNYLSASVSAGEKRIMISVHYYSPWDFCGQEDNVYTQWGPNAKNSSKVPGWGDELYLNNQFRKMYRFFVQKGYPVVIGEYGSIDKSEADSENPACREEYAKQVCTTSIKYGLVPVYWDNGYNGEFGFALFNRVNTRVTEPGIINAIMTAFKDADVKPITPAPAEQTENPAVTDTPPADQNATSNPPANETAAPATDGPVPESPAPETQPPAASQTTAPGTNVAQPPAGTVTPPTTGQDGEQVYYEEEDDEDEVQKVSAPKKIVIKQGKTKKVTVKITAKKKASSVKVSFTKKKIAKCTKKSLKKKACVLNVKGLKKGSATMKVTIGKKSCKIKIQVK